MLDEVERRFWRDVWDSVPAEVAAEHGIKRRDFGPVQVTAVAALPRTGMLNLVLGATAGQAVHHGHLEEALEWTGSLGVEPYVPVTPAALGTEAAERWLREHGYQRGYAWMKFTRDAHQPRFEVSDAVEVVELDGGSEEPFGMIAAAGFGLPAWGAAFFANLPGREGWRCYIALVEGEPQACAAMLIDGGIAEFGIAATLEPARGRGCQLALLRRRILDAAAAGCETLSSRPASASPVNPPPATATSSEPGSRRLTCDRTGSQPLAANEHAGSR